MKTLFIQTENCCGELKSHWQYFWFYLYFDYLLIREYKKMFLV